MHQLVHDRFVDRDSADNVLLEIHAFEESGGELESYEEVDREKLKQRLEAQ